MCSEGGLQGVSLFNLLLPPPHPRLSPPTWPCVEDVSMDAACDDTFLPRGARRVPQNGERGRKLGGEERGGSKEPCRCGW